jgi:hypothetical protein
MLKKEQNKLDKLVRLHVLALGGLITEDEIDLCDKTRRRVVLKLPTKAGILQITPHGNSVFIRFDDVANQVFGSYLGHNRFSGKWNFHCFERVQAQEAFQSFQHQLAMAL